MYLVKKKITGWIVNYYKISKYSYSFSIKHKHAHEVVVKNGSCITSRNERNPNNPVDILRFASSSNSG